MLVVTINRVYRVEQWMCKMPSKKTLLGKLSKIFGLFGIDQDNEQTNDL